MTRPDAQTKPPAEVSAMFDGVSTRYDVINDILSAYNSRLWRAATVRAVEPRKGMRVLDLAAGTGTSSVSFAKQGARVTAADFSRGMLEEGKRRHGDNPLIDFVWADATDLPFEDDTFHASTISFGLRNVVDPKRALAELFRVTKPGGKLVICEFSHPPHSVIRVPYTAYATHVLPKLAGLLGGPDEAYGYLTESIALWPSQDELAGWLRDAGFEGVGYRNLTGGIVALHRGFVPHVPEVTELGNEETAAGGAESGEAAV